MSLSRSMSLGVIASYKEGWIFRSSIAKHLRINVRTVQRGITQAKELGLLGTARAKKGEIPPGVEESLNCGWSHRWVIGWGQAYQAAKAAIEQCRLARMIKHTTHRVMGKAHRANRRMTAEELDAELARTDPAKDDDAITMTRPAPSRRMTAEELDQELERIERARTRGHPP